MGLIVAKESKSMFENVVVKADAEKFSLLRSKHFNIESELALVKMLGLYDTDMISGIESKRIRLDDRTYSLFLLICDEHPLYRLIDKGVLVDSEFPPPLAVRPPSKGDSIKEVRESMSLGKRKMAWLLGLSSKKVISDYEDKEKADVLPSVQCWTLFLLISKSHKYFELKFR